MRRWMMLVALGVITSVALFFAIGANAAPARHAPRSTKAHTVSVTVKGGKTAPSSENGAESEGGSEAESGTESDNGSETDTHEDPNGADVQHECPPSCDTASGEQP